MYKRIELNNLKELQKELIQYNFFNKSPDVLSDDSPLTPLTRSGALFLKIPKIAILEESLDKIVNMHCITHFHIINIPGNAETNIHIDSDNSAWALNIPITNCNNSYTIFYKDGVEVEKITLDTIYLLNIGEYCHQVLNKSNNSRLVMSIRFVGKTLLDILKTT